MERKRFNIEIELPWPHINKTGLSKLLPTSGNVIFTLLMIALLVIAQSAGALPLPSTLSAPRATSVGTIAYQGRLADADGNPLTGTYNMIFRLYDAATGGTPLWEEPWSGSNGVRVSDGLFNVMLGSLTPIPADLIAGHASLFLGITVGTDDEMAPRVQLGSVPFAVQALTVPDGSVTTAKIADRAVTPAKLNLDSSLAISGSLTVNGAINSNYEGFSYYATGFVKPAGWQPLIISVLDFNTFGTATFNTTSGIFTAPKAGFYRFRTHGFIGTASASVDDRIAVGIVKNGVLRAFSGGQFSAGDTPGPQFSHVVYLQAGDTIQAHSFTQGEARFGASNAGHEWWFQGEYIGR